MNISCKEEIEPIDNLIIEESILDFGTALTSTMQKNRLVKHNLYQANVAQENYEQKTMLSKNLMEDLSGPAIKVVSHYGFEAHELIQMFGSEVLNDNKEAVVLTALLIFSKEIESNPRLYLKDFSDTKSSWYSDPIDTSRLAYCAFEALGVELLIDAWYGRAMSRYAIRKALVKALVKVGTRIGLGGLGFALILADVMWCMTR